MPGITGITNTQLGYFNSLVSNRVIARLKGLGVQQAYDNTVSVAADTVLRPDLIGKSVTELKNLCTAPGNFQMQESRAIYQTIGGSTVTTVIPIAKVNKATIVGALGIVTTAFTGAQTISLGIAGDPNFLLGSVVASALTIPAGGFSALWTPTYPYSTASPDAAGVLDGRLYYAQDRLLAPGTVINLYISADAGSIGQGDLTIELLATALGKETFGITDGNAQLQSANGGPGPTFGKDMGPLYRKF